MNLISSLQTAVAVFIGVYGAILALATFPPGQHKRMPAALLLLALILLVALSGLNGATP